MNANDVIIELMVAAKRQLDGMGKGREPSPRLQEAFDAGVKYLGFDPLNIPDPIQAENARLRAQLEASK